jgi:hypothetical protein
MMLLADGNNVYMGPVDTDQSDIETPILVDIPELVETPIQEVTETTVSQEMEIISDTKDTGFVGSIWFWGIIIALGVALIGYMVKKIVSR